MLHLYTPSKHQKTVRFSDFSRRYRNITLRANGLIPDLTLYAPAPQNGQTHSSDHFVGLVLKGLKLAMKVSSKSSNTTR